MTLNIHYKNIQDATKETVRPVLEQKVSDVLKIFGSIDTDDQAITQINVEHHEKNDMYEVRSHMKVKMHGKECNFTAQAENKDLLVCVDQIKNELQAQARKEKDHS